ncbi:hypothetical protein C4587_00995 [Candidatus Parcubacteria bacterium]|nr:MAG: hypothetical protein C4587_00995 [Candidatus Parcubacteria bacterium]
MPPWERYQTKEPAAAGPWTKYGSPPAAQGNTNWSLSGALETPEGQALESQLKDRAARELLSQTPGADSPLYAGVSSAANTALLNIPRNLVAGVHALQTGKPFEQEYARQRDIDEAAARLHPIASAVGTGAGALTQAAAIPVAPAASLAGRAAQGAAIGAGLSGASEFADTKDLERARDAALGGGALGAAAAPIASALAKGVNVGARAVGLSKAPAIPSTEELRGASQAAYKAADDAGVVVNRAGIRNIAQDIKGALAQEAYHPKNQPKLTNFLNELENLSIGRGVPGQPPNIGVTLSGLDTTRKMLRAARASADPEERRMASIAAERFDEYLTNLKPSEIAAGRSKEGIAALNEARSLWSSYRKADMVDEALQAAQLRAASTGSGGNIDNAIRTEFKKILTNRKKSAGFTDAEKAALARIVTATKGQNTLRLLGKLSPAGDGLRLLLNSGAAYASGGSTLPISVLGAGAKRLADNATPRNVEKLSQLIRARGLNITPQDVIDSVKAERLRNFFTSIGVNVGKIAGDLGGEIAAAARGAAGQAPARADNQDAGEIPAVRRQ